MDVVFGIVFVIGLVVGWLYLVDAGWKHTDRKHRWMNEELELRKRVKRHREWEKEDE